MKDIVSRIEQLLKERNISGYKLSKATGISESVISRVRNRKLNPSYEVLSRIAIYFNISKHWLETGEGSMTLSSDSISENHGFYNPNGGKGNIDVRAEVIYRNILEEKDKRIEDLEARLKDKEDIIELLKRQISKQ